MMDEEVLDGAIEKWGKEHQIDMCIEEMAELTIALSHLKRGRIGWKDKSIQEEIADVKIMIAQMERIFNHGMIEPFIDLKLIRLKERIEDDTRKVRGLRR